MVEDAGNMKRIPHKIARVCINKNPMGDKYYRIVYVSHFLSYKLVLPASKNKLLSCSTEQLCGETKHIRCFNNRFGGSCKQICLDIFLVYVTLILLFAISILF